MPHIACRLTCTQPLSYEACQLPTDHMCRVQGASQCIEDAAYLAELFGRVKHRSQITYALDLFQRLRQPLCSEIARRAEQVGKVWALMDGPAQQEREREIRENGDCEYSNPYSHPNVQQLLYEYDPVRDVNVAWESQM